VTDGSEVPDRLYHLALEAEWEEAVRRGGPYRRSTLGRSLDEQGFIHCSLPHQAQTVADSFYRDRDDVVLLVIDARRVGAEVRVEPVGDSGDRFPHIYGPLPLEAVERADPVPLDARGRLDLGPLLDHG
jgi:glutathione S-transferase